MSHGQLPSDRTGSEAIPERTQSTASTLSTIIERLDDTLGSVTPPSELSLISTSSSVPSSTTSILLQTHELVSDIHDLSITAPGPRRSQRATAGEHSNPHHLPRSAVKHLQREVPTLEDLIDRPLTSTPVAGRSHKQEPTKSLTTILSGASPVPKVTMATVTSNGESLPKGEKKPKAEQEEVHQEGDDDLDEDEDDDEVEESPAHGKKKVTAQKKMKEMVKVFGQVVGSHLNGDIGRALKEVTICDGSTPEKTLSWLRDLDEVSAMGIPPAKVALKSSKSPLREFLSKLNWDKDWTELKHCVASNFISADFTGRQRLALQSFQQRPGEALAKFTHEFIRLAQEAHPGDYGHELDDSLAKRYLSALADREMALRVVKQSPQSLQGAIDLVKDEHDASDKLEPPRKGIGKVSSLFEEDSSAIQTLTETVAALTKKVEAISVQPTTPQGKGTYKGTYRSDKNKTQQKSKITCYRCGGPDHIARFCKSGAFNPHAPVFQPRAPGSYTSPQTSKGSSADGKCLRCRRVGHDVTSCQASPPKRPCVCGGRHWYYDCPHRTTQPGNSQQTEPEN